MELTDVALQKCGDKFLVGYPDLHPGLDCALAWRGTNNLCMDLMLDRGNAQKLFNLGNNHFLEVYDDFDRVIKAAGMPSRTWMNLPIPNGRMHIPSADFSSYNGYMAWMMIIQLCNIWILSAMYNRKTAESSSIWLKKTWMNTWNECCQKTISSGLLPKAKKKKWRL